MQISGINLIEGFISEEQEGVLLDTLAKEPWKTGLNQIRYGTSVYSKKLRSESIPEHLLTYCRKIHASGLLDHDPKHVTVNHYDAGSSIAPHIDKPDCGGVITILSLASEATMVMALGADRFEIPLNRRSLIQLMGEARYNWTHEILPVRKPRYSIVFRD
jgi:alkylated DNA repair dioxygenase AlkB